MSATTLYIDLDAVGQLATLLQAIHQSLESTRDDFESFTDDLGSDDVWHSLNGFQHGWKDGRSTIMTEIANLINAIQGAVQDYEETERQLTTTSTDARVATTQSRIR